jgi:hypothetical protein
MKFYIDQINLVSERWGDDVDDFFHQAHCEVKCDGSPGGEAFIVNIVSPIALQKEFSENEAFTYEIGRGFLIVNDYDKNSISKALQRLIDAGSADSWDGLCTYLERYFDWV